MPERWLQRRRHLSTVEPPEAPHKAPPTALLEAPPDVEDQADAPETGPQRRCIVTRRHGERIHMLRFVVGPGETVVPDVLARLPGRGMWLSAERDVLETARTRGAFRRAARGNVAVPDDLLDQVEAGLRRRITELLGLARRAGQAVAGFQKAREWVTSGRTGLIVQASDGSSEERARFTSGASSLPVVVPLAAEALGVVFGRERAVHVAIMPGRLAAALEIESGRLAGVSGTLPATQGRDVKAAPTGQMQETRNGLAVRHDDGTSG